MYAGETEAVKATIHKSILKIARFCRKSYCFRESVSSICKSIGWKVPGQMILAETAKFVHKVISTEVPQHVSELFTYQRSRRTKKVSLRYKFKTNKFERNFMIKSYRIYNGLSEDAIKMSPKRFCKYIKKINIQPP